MAVQDNLQNVCDKESLLKAVFEMIADENTVMIKAAHVGQLLLLKKEKVWQRERIIFDSMIHGVIVQSVLLWYRLVLSNSLIYLVVMIHDTAYSTWCNDMIV